MVQYDESTWCITYKSEWQSSNEVHGRVRSVISNTGQRGITHPGDKAQTHLHNRLLAYQL